MQKKRNPTYAPYSARAFETTSKALQNEKLKLSDKLDSIFSEPESKRSEKDVALALKGLKEVTFFSAMQTQIEENEFDQLLLDTYYCIKYEAFNKGEAVFHYRDKGDKFYIILKGTVDVFIPKTNEELESSVKDIEANILSDLEFINQKEYIYLKEKIEKIKESIAKSVPITTLQPVSNKDCSEIPQITRAKTILEIANRKSLKINRADLEVFEMLSKFESHFHIYFEGVVCKFKKVRTMGQGTYFGELALSKNLPRGASIIASSDLRVITLSKDDYMRIFQKFEKELQAKMKFFAKLTGQKTSDAITKFCYSFKERTYKYGQKIFIQGDMPCEIFVVKQGEVQISKQELEDKPSTSEPAFMLKKKKFTERKIAKLGQYNLLGEGEAILNKPYDTTATSSTNETVLYVVALEEFLSLKAKYSDVFTRIFERHKTKTAYFDTRIENISTMNKWISEEYKNLVKTDAKNALEQENSGLQMNKLKFLDMRLGHTISPEPQPKKGTPLVSNLDLEGSKITLERFFEPFDKKKFQNLSSEASFIKNVFIKRNVSGSSPKIKLDFLNFEKERGNSQPAKEGYYLTETHMGVPFSQQQDRVNKNFSETVKVELPCFFLKFLNQTFREPKTQTNDSYLKTYKELRPYEVDALKTQLKKAKFQSFFQNKNQTPNPAFNSPASSARVASLTEIKSREHRKSNMHEISLNPSGLDFSPENYLNIKPISTQIDPKKTINKNFRVITKIKGPEKKKKKAKIEFADVGLASPFSKRKTPFSLSINNLISIG